jgi:hypothetical protein
MRSKMSRNGFSRILALSTLSIFVSAPVFSEVPSVQSRRAPLPVKLDGQADEWALDSLIRDPKSGAELAFRNDGRNLYILFIVENPEAVKSVESTGMTILGRRGGKKKPAKGVLFLRRDVTAQGYIRWREGQSGFMTEAEKAEARKTERYTISVAFAVDAKGSSYGPLRRQTEADPPDFAVSQDGPKWTYEFRVPLESPDLVPGGLGGTPGQPLRVSFDWGGADGKSISTKAGRESPNSKSGYMSGTGRTWGQEFLDDFDSMSRPSLGTKKFTFAVDVRLAETT